MLPFFLSCWSLYLNNTSMARVMREWPHTRGRVRYLCQYYKTEECVWLNAVISGTTVTNWINLFIILYHATGNRSGLIMKNKNCTLSNFHLTTRARSRVKTSIIVFKMSVIILGIVILCVCPVVAQGHKVWL